jgi:hypothetical protein
MDVGESVPHRPAGGFIPRDSLRDVDLVDTLPQAPELLAYCEEAHSVPDLQVSSGQGKREKVGVKIHALADGRLRRHQSSAKHPRFRL